MDAPTAAGWECRHRSRSKRDSERETAVRVTAGRETRRTRRAVVAHTHAQRACPRQRVSTTTRCSSPGFARGQLAGALSVRQHTRPRAVHTRPRAASGARVVCVVVPSSSSSPVPRPEPPFTSRPPSSPSPRSYSLSPVPRLRRCRPPLPRVRPRLSRDSPEVVPPSRTRQ